MSDPYWQRTLKWFVGRPVVIVLADGGGELRGTLSEDAGVFCVRTEKGELVPVPLRAVLSLEE